MPEYRFGFGVAGVFIPSLKSCPANALGIVDWYCTILHLVGKTFQVWHTDIQKAHINLVSKSLKCFDFQSQESQVIKYILHNSLAHILYPMVRKIRYIRCHYVRHGRWTLLSLILWLSDTSLCFGTNKWNRMAFMNYWSNVIPFPPNKLHQPLGCSYRIYLHHTGGLCEHYFVYFHYFFS